MNDIEYSWESTPQLWMATREGQCFCMDCAGKVPVGFGKTREEAMVDLMEREEEQS